MPCTASVGTCEFDGTQLITDFSFVEHTKLQKQNKKKNNVRVAKRKTDCKARGLDPWAGRKKNSSRGKEDSNEEEDEAGEIDDEDNEEVESEYKESAIGRTKAQKRS